MTTSTTLTPIDHTSTTGLRAWGSEFSAQLAAVGLVQTADTGQINWTTATYSATGSNVAGYEIWRFVDSTIYMKFEYGTGANGAGYPSIWCTVGSGSNGSGTITGGSSVSARSIVACGSIPSSTLTSFPSYYSRTAGHFALLWKAGITGTTAGAFLVIGKTVDGTGATTTTGYGFISANGSTTLPAIICGRLIATASVTVANAKFCTAIGEPVSSADASGNFQIYEAYVNMPDVQPFLYAAGVNANDIPRGTTFSVNMVGATAHTYLGMGNTGLNNHAIPYGLAMLYE